MISVCLELEDPHNGTVTNYTGTEAPVGDNSTFSCDEGYYPNGTEMVTCQANGTEMVTCQANGTNMAPQCKSKKSCNQYTSYYYIYHCLVVNCSRPDNSNNITLNVSMTTYNEIAQFSCDPGYTLNGSEFIMCHKQENDTAPQCECK